MIGIEDSVNAELLLCLGLKAYCVQNDGDLSALIDDATSSSFTSCYSNNELLKLVGSQEFEED